MGEYHDFHSNRFKYICYFINVRYTVKNMSNNQKIYSLFNIFCIGMLVVLIAESVLVIAIAVTIEAIIAGIMLRLVITNGQ